MVQWVRPIESAVYDEQNKLVSGWNKLGLGILYGKYVITTIGAMVELPILPQLAGGDELPVPADLPDFSSWSMRAWLIWDSEWGGEDFIKELIERASFDEEVETELKDLGIVIFERSGDPSYPAAPIGFSVKIGHSAELEGLDKLIAFSYEKSKEGKVNLLTREASFNAEYSEKYGFLFQGSTFSEDLGSPIFALRDGEPEIVGILKSTSAYYGAETRGLAVGIDYVISLLEKVDIHIEK